MHRRRLSLGIGMSHQVTLNDLGMRDDKPIRHLREYLEAQMPMVETGHVDVAGDAITAKADVIYPVTDPPEVTVAALGPQALRIAGRMAAGTNLDPARSRPPHGKHHDVRTAAVVSSDVRARGHLGDR
jgi:5,10-methylenetetrahydromethanopterin reductase